MKNKKTTRSSIYSAYLKKTWTRRRSQINCSLLRSSDSHNPLWIEWTPIMNTRWIGRNNRPLSFAFIISSPLSSMGRMTAITRDVCFDMRWRQQETDNSTAIIDIWMKAKWNTGCYSDDTTLTTRTGKGTRWVCWRTPSSQLPMMCSEEVKIDEERIEQYSNRRTYRTKKR